MAGNALTIASPGDRSRARSASRATLALGFATGAAPILLAFSVPPIPSLFNEVLAVLCCGLLASHLGRHGRYALSARAEGRAVVAAMGLIALAAWLPPLRQNAPAGLALMTTGLMLASLVVFQLGAQQCRQADPHGVFGGFGYGLVFAGVVNTGVAVIQVYFPALADGQVIPILHAAGEAVGTIRQANHLAALLVWALVAVGYLLGSCRLPAWLCWTAAVLLCAGESMSGSRSGFLNIVLISAWAALDKALPRAVRALFAALAPLAVGWALLLAWISAMAGITSGLAARVGASQGVASRWLILVDALESIWHHPWWGTGWGEFNFVWTLTPRSWQTLHHVSHSHNLVVELLAELGIPLGAIVVGLLAWSLWRALRACLAAEDAATSLARRCALAMVVTMAVYSQFEYPLWFAYFLLPTAFFLGIGIGRPDSQAQPSPADGAASRPGGPAAQRPMVIGGLLIALAGMFVLYDYMKVVQIFVPPTIPQPTSMRIAQGQGSLLFRPFADYAAANHDKSADPAVLYSAAHAVLDERLLSSWADALHAAGDDDRARFLIQRALMFKSPLVEQLEARCASSSRSPAAYPCGLPARPLSAEDFRP